MIENFLGLLVIPKGFDSSFANAKFGDKIAALEAAGVKTVRSLAEIGSALCELLK